MKFGHGKWLVGSVYYARKDDIPLAIIIPAVIVPMLLFIAVSVYCYRFDSHTSSLVFLFVVFVCSFCLVDDAFDWPAGGRVSRQSESTRR